HKERTRVCVVQEIRVAGDDDQGGAAVAYRVRVSVNARNTKLLSDELAVVEACDRLALPRPAEKAVVEKSRREQIGRAERRELRAEFTYADGASGGAQRGATAPAESRIAAYGRIHDRVLAPDRIVRRAVPVDLCIEIILVERLRAVGEEIRRDALQV